VCDTGTGIPGSALSRVFNAFQSKPGWRPRARSVHREARCRSSGALHRRALGRWDGFALHRRDPHAWISRLRTKRAEGRLPVSPTRPIQPRFPRCLRRLCLIQPPRRSVGAPRSIRARAELSRGHADDLPKMTRKMAFVGRTSGEGDLRYRKIAPAQQFLGSLHSSCD
jgi:hypothetical protein